VEADQVIAATNQAVAAAAQIDTSNRTGPIRLDQAASRGQSAEAHQITRLKDRR
jgi:hypothetical protein